MSAARALPPPKDRLDEARLTIALVTDAWQPQVGQAAQAALRIPRERARERALAFDWSAVCNQFVSLLVPNCQDQDAGRARPVSSRAEPVEQVG